MSHMGNLLTSTPDLAWSATTPRADIAVSAIEVR